MPGGSGGSRWNGPIGTWPHVDDLTTRNAGFSDLGPEPGGRLQLRDVLVAQIAEYARHCGHADLLRELIDGRVGQ